MRTGTVSCAEALRTLGYSTAHFDELKQAMGEENSWLAGDMETDKLERFDAAFDNPIPAVYPQLDQRYPGSKFILTTREQTAWLTSCEQYLKKVPAAYEYRKLVRTAVYGMHDFNRERWEYIYRNHLANVQEYFRDRVNDLLVIDICSGEGWDRLCPFLNQPIPNTDFPKLNTRSNLVFK